MSRSVAFRPVMELGEDDEPGHPTLAMTQAVSIANVIVYRKLQIVSKTISQQDSGARKSLSHREHRNGLGKSQEP